MHSILTYLLLCPLVGIAGFVDAIAGGGGLISGVAACAKQINPRIQIIGVQAEGAPAIANSFRAGERKPSPGSRRCCVSSLPWLAPAWAQSWR